MKDCYQIAYIRWLDTLQFDKTEAGDILPSPTTVHTVGFLLETSSESVVIAQEWLPDVLQYKNVIAIPRSMVESEVILSQCPDWPLNTDKKDKNGTGSSML